jgi:iron complex outermembrane receptor protein
MIRRVAFGSLLLMTTSGLALAQTAADNPSSAPVAPTGKSSQSSDNLAEVVVTASKQSEDILKAPVSVSVVSPLQLQQAGVVGLEDLNSIVPSLHVADAGTYGSITFSMRGISNSDIYESAQSPIATYIDGVYVGRPDAMNGMLYDLDHIEVLKGPQGTLYGRNSTGGNVNILTAAPERKFDASVDVGYGNYNELQTRGMLNLPVTDTLAIRAAFAERTNNGTFDTLGSTARNYGVANQWSGRLSAKWDPSDKFVWNLVLEYYQNEGTPPMDILAGPNGQPADGLPVFRRKVNNVEEPGIDQQQFTMRSRMDWNVLDNVTLSYIAGYQYMAERTQGMVGGYSVARDTPFDSNQQEVDLNLQFGPVRSIFGGNYYVQQYDPDNDLDLFGANILLFVDDHLKTEAYGLFNQTTWDVTDSLRLTGGVRYSSERFVVSDYLADFCPISSFPPSQYGLVSLLYQQRGPLIYGNPVCQNVYGVAGGLSGGTNSDSAVTWKAALSYDWSNQTSSYATVSTGFKSGGLNLGVDLSPIYASYKPETVTNYEVGLKTRAFNNTLSLNTAFYLMDYNNIQINQLTDVNGKLSSTTTNAAGAKNYGSEIEWNWKLDPATKFGGYFNYVHATYSNYTNAIDALTNVLYPSLTGNTLPFAPRYSVEGRLEHEFVLPHGDIITPKATVYWQSQMYLRGFDEAIDKVPSYAKVDFNLNYTDPTGQWSLDGYVHNLTNAVIRNGQQVLAGEYLNSYDPPRLYGARLSWHY